MCECLEIKYKFALRHKSYRKKIKQMLKFNAFNVFQCHFINHFSLLSLGVSTSNFDLYLKNHLAFNLGSDNKSFESPESRTLTSNIPD